MMKGEKEEESVCVVEGERLKEQCDDDNDDDASSTTSGFIAWWS